MEKILTVPRDETEYREVFPTGNEYISLPDVTYNGDVMSINVLSTKALGLIEFLGSEENPFLTPYCKVDGGNEYPQRVRREWLDHWIVGLKMDLNRGKVELQQICPPGERGMVYLIKYYNDSLFAQKVTLGLQGTWEKSHHTIFNRCPLEGQRLAGFDSWTGALTLELRSGLPLVAIALKGGGGNERWGFRIGDEPLEIHNSFDAGKEKISFYLEKDVELASGESYVWPVYLAVNVEVSGATTTSIHLQRQGWEALLARTRKWLQNRKVFLTEKSLENRANYNLFFSYFFATGRGIEDDEFYLITSRSPRYYVSAAFWPRDGLLWTFPGLLTLDEEIARQALKGVFSRHWRNHGIHSQYINGTVLYPGFELDQLCAYLIALESYIDKTDDAIILEELPLKSLVKEFLQELWSWKAADDYIFATFLDPSDDPPTYPYLTYNQVLVWKTVGFLKKLSEERDTGVAALWLDNLQDSIRTAILHHAVVTGPQGEEMLAGTFDGQGSYELYENPPGSLALLPYYGFLPEDDPLILNTMNWVNSKGNPYYMKGNFPGTGALHAKSPWVLAVISEILGGYDVQNRLRWLKNAQLDGNLACETVDNQDGQAKTGLAFASCAGFLGYSIFYRWGERRKADGKV